MTPKRIASSARQLVASSHGWRRNVNRSSRCAHRRWASRSLAAFVLAGKTRSDSWFSRWPRGQVAVMLPEVRVGVERFAQLGQHGAVPLFGLLQEPGQFVLRSL